MNYKCKNHTFKEALGSCQTCGEHFCENCLFMDGDYNYCKEHNINFDLISFNFERNSMEKEMITISRKTKKNIRFKRVLFGSVWFIAFYIALWLLFAIIFYLFTPGEYSTFEEGYSYGNEASEKFVESGGRILLIFLSAFISFILSYKGLLPGTSEGKKIKMTYSNIEKKKENNKAHSISKLFYSIIKNPNKLIAIYILWVSLHLILFVTSGNFISYDGEFLLFRERFYPFSEYSDLKDYDLTELIVYLIIPFTIYLFIRLWTKNKDNNN